MPEHRVTERIQETNQRVGFVGPVAFAVQHGLAAGDGGGRSPQYTFLHPLDIDFDEIATGQLKTVDGRQRHSLALFVCAQFDTAEVFGTCVIERRHGDPARFAAQRHIPAIDVRQTVQSQIATQCLKENALRLNGQHPPRRSHVFGEEQRVRANIRPHFQHDFTRCNKLLEQQRFTLREFAVQLNRTADVNVVDVVDQLAKSSLTDGVERSEVGHDEPVKMSGVISYGLQVPDSL